MEERIKYREALGLTQDEAAQLLKIPKSLLGMFEIGQRDLPSPIKLQLVTLYNLVQKQVTVSNPKKKENTVQELILEINKALLETQYKQQLLERKLTLFQSKFQKSERLLQFVHVLENELKKEAKPSQDFITVLQLKADKEVAKYGPLSQIKLELKIKALKAYQKAIEAALNHFIPKQ